MDETFQPWLKTLMTNVVAQNQDSCATATNVNRNKQTNQRVKTKKKEKKKKIRNNNTHIKNRKLNCKPSSTRIECVLHNISA